MRDRMRMWELVCESEINSGMLNELTSLLWFCDGAPAGRYTLNLATFADLAVAERLLLINAWDVEVQRAHGDPDISQKGGRDGFRNEVLDRAPFDLVASWRLKAKGVLSCDYVSVRHH